MTLCLTKNFIPPHWTTSCRDSLSLPLSVVLFLCCCRYLFGSSLFSLKSRLSFMLLCSACFLLPSLVRVFPDLADLAQIHIFPLFLFLVACLWSHPHVLWDILVACGWGCCPSPLSSEVSVCFFCFLWVCYHIWMCQEGIKARGTCMFAGLII